MHCLSVCVDWQHIFSGKFIVAFTACTLWFRWLFTEKLCFWEVLQQFLTINSRVCFIWDSFCSCVLLILWGIFTVCTLRFPGFVLISATSACAQCTVWRSVVTCWWYSGKLDHSEQMSLLTQIQQGAIRSGGNHKCYFYELSCCPNIQIS